MPKKKCCSRGKAAKAAPALPKVTMSIKPVQSKNLVTRDIEGKLILMPLTKTSKELNYIYTLNETAAVVWNKFNVKTSLGNIGNALSQKYNVPGAKVEKELLEFVKDLASFKAVTYTQGASKSPAKPKAPKKSAKKKLRWIPLQIFRVPLDPSQAVLSCCDQASGKVENTGIGNQCVGTPTCAAATWGGGRTSAASS